MTDIRDHKDVINHWDSPWLFAQEVGIEPSYARCIKTRNSIPVDLWPRVLRAAKRRKFSHITWQLLVDTRKSRSRIAA